MGKITRTDEDKAIQAIEKISRYVNIPTNLKDLGVREEDFELMAKMALRDGNAISNPIQGNEKDIVSIFKSAF